MTNKTENPNGELLMQCHDCGERVEKDEMVIVHVGDEVEPPGFVYLCPSCANERERKEEAERTITTNKQGEAS